MSAETRTASGRRRWRPRGRAVCRRRLRRAGSRSRRPTFRVQIDAVTMDVIVKDEHGRFIPDLDEGRVRGLRGRREAGDHVDDDEPRRPRHERARSRRRRRRPKASSCRRVRRVNDTSGRIFLFFVDDLHLQFQNSGRVRELFKKIAKNARPRRRSVRHRLERTVVDRDRHDLRPASASTTRSRRLPATA